MSTGFIREAYLLRSGSKTPDKKQLLTKNPTYEEGKHNSDTDVRVSPLNHYDKILSEFVSSDKSYLTDDTLIYMTRMTDINGVDFLKIGYTDNIKQRLKGLNYEYSVCGKIKLLLVTKGNRKKEQVIHKMSKEYLDHRTKKLGQKCRETYKDNEETLEHFRNVFEKYGFDETFVCQNLDW